MATADLSMVIPNYNHARYLPRVLASIYSQGVLPREVVVVDDASTDSSLQVLEEQSRRHPTLRVVRNETNRGVVKTLNRGIEEVETSCLCLLGADDYLLPGFIEKSMSLLERHPQAGLAFSYDSCQHGEGGPIIPNPSGFPERPDYYPPEEVCRWLRHTIGGHTAVHRRTALIEQGGFAEDLAWYCDWYANVAIAFRHGACHIPEPLAVRVLLSASYSAAAKSGPKNVELVGHFLDRVLMEEARIAELFRRQGGATYFGTDLIRAAALRTDCWEPRVLGFLNGFEPEQYRELLGDANDTVREIAAFFLGPFWQRAKEKRAQQENTVLQLRDELAAIRKQLPPPGTVSKLRWLAGRATRKFRASLSRAFRMR
jgi:glycosyltransferase involved in cell wall biosynthesis